MNINIALCKGRHEIPQATDGSLFPENIPGSLLTNPEELEDYAFSRLWSICHKKGFTYTEDDGTSSISSFIHVNLYVTGLSVALIAALNMCKDESLTVTLYHYNRETGEYYSQEVK